MEIQTQNTSIRRFLEIKWKEGADGQDLAREALKAVKDLIEEGLGKKKAQAEFERLCKEV